MMLLALSLAGACSDDESVSEISGVVVEVRATGLTEIDSFTIRAEDRTYEFLVTAETELAFPPAHLNEHRVSGEPVQVTFEREDDGLYALTVDDA